MENELVHCIWNVTIKEKKLPKSWEVFCEMNPIKNGEVWIDIDCEIIKSNKRKRNCYHDKSSLPNRETAEAVLALCQLIQLRECYNQGWKPDWKNGNKDKYIIDYVEGKIYTGSYIYCSPILYFKTRELRDLFLENFRTLIEKLKPLYGIIKGGEE